MPSSKQRIQHTKPTVYQTIGLEKRGQLIKPNEATAYPADVLIRIDPIFLSLILMKWSAIFSFFILI